MDEIRLDFPYYAMRNSEHYQLNRRLLKYIPVEFAEKYGVSASRSKFQLTFYSENECYVGNTKFASTNEIETLDKKRSNLFIFFLKTIQSGLYNPEEAVVNAAKRMEYLIKPYKDAYRLSYAQKSAMIADFVDLVQDDEIQTDLEALGLANTVSKLEEANEEFDTVYETRSTERLNRSISETMKTVRPKVDKAFTELAKDINAFFRVNELTTKDAETRTDFLAVIEKVNSLLYEMEKTLSRAGIIGKPSGSTSGDEDEPTPEPTKPMIVDIYQKEGGDPERPLQFKKGKTAVIEGSGLTLLNAEGTGIGDIILSSAIMEEPIDDKVPAEYITLNTDSRIEFTMIEYLTEGEYNIRIETYYNGEGNPPLSEPVVIKFPEVITLIM
ncbi:hypothetical protein B5F77_10945 [Parabacteroides sp. An277]|uniref:DUF6261 family protein n=1 Tax=Parabacteroides sp. An277 TaxID=1965619 RepID=UPI000B3A3BEF|nr:DUF6261 family protein [Parabacteroides sp. An277]OUO51248.1 hypothetical protein B5F77_10945 [Parabacteroides sp. An277]